MEDIEFIERFIEGQLRNGEIKKFNAAGTWASFQRAYVMNLVLWDVTAEKVIENAAFGFQVHTKNYSPGWVIITMNDAALYRIYFVQESTLIASKDDVYITDLVKAIDDEL